MAAWARDAFALAAPAKVLCREDCAGLCPECAADLNEAGPEHRHEHAPRPRWAKLSDARLIAEGLEPSSPMAPKLASRSQRAAGTRSRTRPGPQRADHNGSRHERGNRGRSEVPAGMQ